MSATKIFIVEDEQIIAMGIEAGLVYSGYEVVGMTTSGEKALPQIVQTQPDLILMDIMLAGDMDGIQTAEKVKAQLDIPIVFLTAFNDESTVKRAQNANPFGYLTKPCEDRDLVPTIEVALARHRSEAAVRVALAREQELLELKSHFICMISHEFRNPLAAIMSSQELIEVYCNKGNYEKINPYCDRIAKSVEKLEGLIQSVLTLANTQSQEFRFEPQSVNLLRFCQELVEEFQFRIDNNHTIEFTHQGCGEEAQNNHLFHLDPKLLEHIFTNLLSNAIKYSPQGGTVSFNVCCDRQQIHFQIQDEGIGIPPEAQLKLFSAFQRAKNVGKIPGTGLGLAIVKQCVQLHGGQITCQSDLGQGTTFKVSLPFEKAEGRRQKGLPILKRKRFEIDD
jgi:signal transduction histidine kinase